MNKARGETARQNSQAHALGERPYTTENGNKFAKRLLDRKYGEGNYETGPTSEYNKIKKWGDRAFEIIKKLKD